eukprot:2275560-Prymnesium_polylepis.1
MLRYALDLGKYDLDYDVRQPALFREAPATSAHRCACRRTPAERFRAHIRMPPHSRRAVSRCAPPWPGTLTHAISHGGVHEPARRSASQRRHRQRKGSLGSGGVCTGGADEAAALRAQAFGIRSVIESQLARCPA